VRSKARGSTRCTFALAGRFKALQAVPITINGQQQIYVDLRDGLSHALLAGSPWETVPWEIDEQKLMRRLVRPGDVVLDVGAHIGLHTVLLSALTTPRGVVHAFEANPGKVDVLSLTASRLPNTIIHPFGLSDRAGRATLFVPEDQSMSSLSNWTEGQMGAIQEVPCELKRLDDLVAASVVPSPDFIKCDVEGGEAGVFKGAACVLNRPNAPIILYEANQRSARAAGCTISEATDFLKRLRGPSYLIFHVLGEELIPINTFPADCDHYNLLAVPAASAGRLRV
jgi:FkbM family methyltransferase